MTMVRVDKRKILPIQINWPAERGDWEGEGTSSFSSSAYEFDACSKYIQISQESFYVT